MMAKMQVDKGAIRFVLGGANVMCPGFTSPGGALPQELGVDVPVV
jgi:malignant T-cell-amplified sequence